MAESVPVWGGCHVGREQGRCAVVVSPDVLKDLAVIDSLHRCKMKPEHLIWKDRRESECGLLLSRTKALEWHGLKSVKDELILMVSKQVWEPVHMKTLSTNEKRK